MIDIHCHILPGLDDGPRDMAESIALARACVAEGTTHIVATPHYLPGRWENRRAGIEQAAQAFRDALAKAGIPLGVLAGAEVRFGLEVFELLDAGDVPFIGEHAGEQLLLLELPDGQVPLGTETMIARLRQRRVRPILAHPERNKGVMADPERAHRLVDAGALLQVTAGSLTGAFGRAARETAEYLLDEHLVTVVASDFHNLRHRPPAMRAARDTLIERCGKTVAQQLTTFHAASMCGLRDAVLRRAPAVG